MPEFGEMNNLKAHTLGSAPSAIPPRVLCRLWSALEYEQAGIGGAN